MVEPAELLGWVRHALAQDGPLAGYKIVVTAGGTQEPLDPVRVITNRSSGKQGFAMAQAALDLGADVTLISAPTSLLHPYGVKRVDVTTAQEMLEAVLLAMPDCDILVKAAAVADFRPSRPVDDKIKKTGAAPNIQMEKTEDILLRVAEQKSDSGRPLLTVGFAAESSNLLQNARTKLTAKRLDLIVANDISAADAGFSVDTNRVTILLPDGSSESLPLLSKDQVAREVFARVVRILPKD
jgi:phosphopantothenoylcysteine decarboxylase/phosphopantothenate--cysteine ligase